MEFVSADLEEDVISRIFRIYNTARVGGGDRTGSGWLCGGSWTAGGDLVGLQEVSRLATGKSVGGAKKGSGWGYRKLVQPHEGGGGGETPENKKVGSAPCHLWEQGNLSSSSSTLVWCLVLLPASGGLVVSGTCGCSSLGVFDFDLLAACRRIPAAVFDG